MSVEVLSQPGAPGIFSVILELALPLFVFVVVISALGVASIKYLFGGSAKTYAPFLFAFAFLGGVPGVIAGASQEPIVGAMLTGLLGIVSALLAYLFSKDSTNEWRPVIPFAIMAMVICSLVGLTIGGIRRAKFDNFDREFAIFKSELENLYYPVEKERRLEMLRRMLRQEEHEQTAVAKGRR